MPLDMIMGLRIAQAIFAMVGLGLNAAVLSWFNTIAFPVANNNNTVWMNPIPTSLVFLSFTSVFTLLVALPYVTFAPKYFRAISSGWASLAIEALTNLFWFCGWIASAAYVGKLTVCRGAICGAARASVVFGVLSWICWCATLWFPVRYCFFSPGIDNSNDKMTGSGRLRALRLRRDGGATGEGKRQKMHRMWLGQKEKFGIGGGVSERQWKHEESRV